jgi:hypothetical protein
MNVQETAAVLAYFGAAFPNMDITDDTADVWAFELRDIHADFAEEAMRNVVKESEFPPTIARFREAVQHVARARTLRKPVPALDGPASVMPAEVIAELRANLKDWSSRKHDHRGPGPCPVCGSVPPPEKPSGRASSSRVEPLDPSWCCRCGQKTMPYINSIEPREVEPVAPYREQDR